MPGAVNPSTNNEIIFLQSSIALTVDIHQVTGSKFNYPSTATYDTATG